MMRPVIGVPGGRDGVKSRRNRGNHASITGWTPCFPDMPWPETGAPQRNHVETQGEPGRILAPGLKGEGSAHQSCLLSRCDRLQGGGQFTAPFDLDDDQNRAAPGNNINFTDRRTPVPGEDLITGAPQTPGRQRFRPATGIPSLQAASAIATPPASP